MIRLDKPREGDQTWHLMIRLVLALRRSTRFGGVQGSFPFQYKIPSFLSPSCLFILTADDFHGTSSFDLSLPLILDTAFSTFLKIDIKEVLPIKESVL